MSGPWPKGVGFYGLLGGGLVIAASFLPWLTLGGKSISAWQIPVLSLLPGHSISGPPAGILLMVGVLVLLPYLIRRPLPTWLRIVVAAVGSNLALVLLVAELRASPTIFPGLGVLVALAGAVLIILGDLGESKRSTARSSYG